MRGRHDLRPATCVRADQLHEQSRAAGVHAVFDLLDGHDLRHGRLEACRYDGGETEGSVAEYGCREILASLAQHEHGLADGTRRGAHVVDLLGAQFAEPVEIALLRSLVLTDADDQGREILAPFPHALDRLRLGVAPQDRLRRIDLLHVRELIRDFGGHVRMLVVHLAV